MTQEEINDRMESCPWREHPQGDTYVCTRYVGTYVPCDGCCGYVADYPRLKELENDIKKKKTMKYIDAEKIKTEIDKIINGLKRNCNPDPMGTMEECMAAAEIEALELVKATIDEMKQEDPTPPGIEEESQKKGWLDYGLMMSEIGLHRYNAIRRIKEHKEEFDPLKIPDLYHVAEYYEAVGAEKTCCCLQAYGNDFIFTQDEVKEIIKNEQ